MEQDNLFIAPTLQASYRTLHELSDQSDVARDRRRKLQQFEITFYYWGRCGIRAQSIWRSTPWSKTHGGRRHGYSTSPCFRDGQCSKNSRHEDSVGMLTPEKRADFVIVRRSPLEDISALCEAEAIFLAGEGII